MTKNARDQLARLAQLADSSTVDDGEVEELLLDPGWEEVAAGTADDAVRAALDQEAVEHGLPDLSERFEPYDEAARARLQAAVDAAAAKPAQAEVRRPSGPAIRRASASRGWRYLLTAALALTAAAAIGFWTSTTTTTAPAPRYAMTLGGGQRAWRSEEPSSQVYAPGSELIVSLRPERRVESSPALRAWLVGPEGSLPLEGRVLVAESGALRFRTRLPQAWPGMPVSVWVVLAEEDDLPGRDADVTELTSDHLQILRQALPTKERSE